MLSKKKRIILSFLGFVLCAGIVTVGGLSLKSSAQKLRYRCLQKMGRGDCAIMHNTGVLPANVQQIFISGYGNLNADTYRQLKSSGIYMCEMIYQACAQDENSETCRFGQAVY